MNTHVLILRPFSGFTSGEVVDTTGWVHAKSLEEDRYIRPLDKDEVASAVDCQCGTRILPEADLHFCAIVEEEQVKADVAKANAAAEAKRAATIEAAKAKAKAAHAPAPANAPTPTSTPEPAPAA